MTKMKCICISFLSLLFAVQLIATWMTGNNKEISKSDVLDTNIAIDGQRNRFFNWIDSTFIRLHWNKSQSAANLRENADASSKDSRTSNASRSQNDSSAVRKPARVFCWIMTRQKNYDTRTVFLEDTWPQRCDDYVFFTDNNEGLNESHHKAIFANLTDGHGNLWLKTKAAMRYIYEHYLNDFDYFVKADDDTYMFVENLRYFLEPFNSANHHYFGYKWVHEIKHGHASGGAGYVLSRRSQEILVDVLTNETICPEILAIETKEIAEDLEVGLCLQNLGIFLENTMDAIYRNKFLPLNPENYNLLGKVGEEQMARDLIGIHYVSPKEYRLIDFFVYRFRLASKQHKL